MSNPDELAKSADSLGGTESTFNLFVSAVKDYAIFILDPKGVVKTWNLGAQRIKGYRADEIIGKHFSIFYSEKARSIDHPGFELAEAIEKGSYEEEGWRVRKDGSQFWASVTITTIREKGEVIGFVKVTRDLTERKNYEMELEKARDEAILANELKSKFVANVTHEIRTPLTGIVGLSELLTVDDDISDDVRQTGKRIFDASKQLLLIVNDLLDFAKLESGKMNVENISFDIRDLADKVHGLTELKAQNKGLSYRIIIDSAIPKTLYGDPTKIRQVLLNLVDNAIKFTERGGIELSIEKQEDNIFYSVTDTGIGIDSVIKDKLFKPFVQAHESTARLFGGTGLGLSIANQFVSLMNGEIGVFSEIHKGTTVWFSLPLLEEEKI